MDWPDRSVSISCCFSDDGADSAANAMRLCIPALLMTTFSGGNYPPMCSANAFDHCCEVMAVREWNVNESQRLPVCLLPV
jgi:hypothetical protein